MDRSHPKFKEVMNQFLEKWQPETWQSELTTRPPRIKAIYQLTFFSERQDYIDKLNQLKAAGSGANERRRFHGTRLNCKFEGTPCSDQQCNVCMILKDRRFSMKKVGAATGGAVYGHGLYFTS